jgi:hypothetical protein
MASSHGLVNAIVPAVGVHVGIGAGLGDVAPGRGDGSVRTGGKVLAMVVLPVAVPDAAPQPERSHMTTAMRAAQGELRMTARLPDRGTGRPTLDPPRH